MALPAQADSSCADCAPAAFEWNATYTGEIWRQTTGGIAQGGRYLDNLDATLTVDGERAFGVEGLQLFGYALYNNGQGLCDELVGAAQCVSNIEATHAAKVYELWAEWSGGDQSLRFGLYDVNSDFDSIETAGLFINPSHGIGPDYSQSGANGPSIFPVTGLGVRAARSFGSWSAQLAVVDGVPGEPDRPDRPSFRISSHEGALVAAEVSRRFESGARIGVGYWRYTADFEDLIDAHRRDDNAGAYFIAESPLFPDSTDEGVALFVRAGEAESRINPIASYFGAGLTHTTHSASGLPRQFGVAVATARSGAPWRQGQSETGAATTAHERIYEATYRIALTRWLTLQPDVQYIDHPGMDPTLDSAWIVGLRFEASLPGE